MFDINFNTFFSVQILHSYYANLLCPDFFMVPSPDTAEVLNDYNMVWKQLNNTLYTGILTDPNNYTIPFLAPSANQRLTFYLQSKNPLFFNFTDLPLENLGSSILYFTNRNNNLVNGAPGLSATAAGGQVSAVDLLSCPGKSYAYVFSPALPAQTIQISINDFYTNALIGSQSFAITTGQGSVLVDLSSLDPGKYTLSSIAGQPTYPVYYSACFAGNNYCGVIDIFNDPGLPANYLLENGGVFSSPAYVISFLSRSTVWKYILQNGTTTGAITDSAAIYTFKQTLAAANILTSTTAIPLSQQPLPLQLTYSGYPSSTPIAIPSAAITGLALKDAASNPYYYSEIYLNY